MSVRVRVRVTVRVRARVKVRVRVRARFRLRLRARLRDGRRAIGEPCEQRAALVGTLVNTLLCCEPGRRDETR